MTRAPRQTPKVRVLIVDDSPGNRRTLTLLLESSPDIEVVGRASDGEEGLKQANALRPDVITLDLEMPKLDGFAFLRLLMANVPTPVIVISSYAHRSDVFKALDLGAFDFIAKPSRTGKDELDRLRRELLEKVRSVRLVRPDARRSLTPPPSPAALRKPVAEPPPMIVAVGASTGGPPAVQRILESVPPDSPLCLLVSQHMPPRFTTAFAERLDRTGAWTVTEAASGDVPARGRAFICPGGFSLQLLRNGKGTLELEVVPPAAQDKHAPSVDRLFESAARVLGSESLGIVLTGMGADGAEGCRALRKAGGQAWAESEKTAVIYGMPREAIATGAVQRVLALDEVGPALAAEAQKRRNRG